MWITGLVEAIGPLGIGLVLLVENLFPPIPSEAVLPFAGFLVYRGQLSLGAALVSSTLGSVAGALILYEAGRRGGRRFVRRWGHVLRVDEEDLDRVGGWIDRHGPAVIMGARMIPFARSVVSIPAGDLGMPLPRFVLLTALGSLAWNALLIGGGVLFGANYQAIADVADRYGVVVVVLLAVAYVVFRVRRRNRDRDRDRPRASRVD